MNEKMNEWLNNGDIVISEQTVPSNDVLDKKSENVNSSQSEKSKVPQRNRNMRNDDSSTRIILIAILAVGVCLFMVSVIGMIGVSRNAASPDVQVETTTQNTVDTPVNFPNETTTVNNVIPNVDNNTTVASQENTTLNNDSNASLTTPKTDSEWLSFFNNSVNKLKTDGPSMTKAKRTQTADIQLSNSLAQAYVSTAKDKYLSDETVKTQVAKGDVSSAKTVISPDGASFVSNLAMSDIKAISHSTDSNGNYVVKIDMPDAVNPDTNGVYGKIFTFMTVDDVMNTYAPNMGATVDRANVQLKFSGCYAQAVISPDGKIVSYYTKVNANMILKDAKISVVKTDLNVTLYSDTEYTDIKW